MIDRTLERDLLSRSNNKCELCTESENLLCYEVKPNEDAQINTCAVVCRTCHIQIETPQEADPNHWRCLNDSMWSQVPAVQVIVYRMLHILKNEGWPRDLMDMLYLDEETLAWAKNSPHILDENAVQHIDANGNILAAGDNVVIIQDLNVKGANMVAKRGTTVRRISLVADNPEHIEGKVNDQRIVILTKYVKKS